MVATAMIVSGFTFQQKKRIIFFGDSITQAGVQPGGYITVLGELLKQKGLDNNYELNGAGIGGNKVYDLVKQGGPGLYSDYAMKDFQEFWAESVEIFFEKPVQLKVLYPALYQVMSDLLNQDPANPPSTDSA